MPDPAETSKPSRAETEESLRMLGLEPSTELVDWATEDAGSLLPDPATGGARASDDDVLGALLEAHRDATTHTDLLALARARRRMLAALLHKRGYSYRWIGEQLGVSLQAVEGFIKYRQRRK